MAFLLAIPTHDGIRRRFCTHTHKAQSVCQIKNTSEANIKKGQPFEEEERKNNTAIMNLPLNDLLDFVVSAAIHSYLFSLNDVGSNEVNRHQMAVTRRLYAFTHKNAQINTHNQYNCTLPFFSFSSSS